MLRTPPRRTACPMRSCAISTSPDAIRPGAPGSRRPAPRICSRSPARRRRQAAPSRSSAPTIRRRTAPACATSSMSATSWPPIGWRSMALRAGGDSMTINCGYGRGYSVLRCSTASGAFHGRKLDVRLAPRREGDLASVMADTDAHPPRTRLGAGTRRSRRHRRDIAGMGSDARPDGPKAGPASPASASRAGLRLIEALRMPRGSARRGRRLARPVAHPGGHRRRTAQHVGEGGKRRTTSVGLRARPARQGGRRSFGRAAAAPCHHSRAQFGQPRVDDAPVLPRTVALDDAALLQIVEHGDHGRRRDVGIGRQRRAGDLAEFGDTLQDDELRGGQAGRLTSAFECRSWARTMRRSAFSSAFSSSCRNLPRRCRVARSVMPAKPFI
jgi:hypothetical protein